jgi:hypothetical protein
VGKGTYEELLASSSLFSRLLENIHQQKQEQQERSMTSDYKRTSRCTTFSEPDDQEVISVSTINIEAKQEGSVNWRVYIAYMRAGAGLALGIFLIIFVFGIREATSAFYNWWLAKWSDDENYRYRQLNNCTGTSNKLVYTIQSMNENEWNDYQKRRFNIYSGLFT